MPTNTMTSKRELKRRRKAKMCDNKCTYRTLSEAKKSGLRTYQCPQCYYYHNTSQPDMNEVAEVMREHK